MKPLTGHTSPETAYNVDDYPYGRTLRCKIRYWLERKETKGFRFVSQTENPKTGRWNAPKPSTYMMFAGAMFLDEKDHCHWAGLSEYSGAKEVRAFLVNYPETDTSLLKPFCVAKMAMCQAGAKGKVKWTINGKAIEPTEAELATYAQDAIDWREVCQLLGVLK
jgi:hypothetical protein